MINFEISYHNVDLDLIQKELEKVSDKIDKINQNFINLPLLTISKQTEDIRDIQKIANVLIKKKECFVILGTGGSNLGSRALINALSLEDKKNILFFDNIDPLSFKNSILKLNIEKTGFIIISKSGLTSETLSQFSSIIEIFKLKNNMKALLKDCLIITENKDSTLRKIAKKYTCHILDHDKDIGGRYSVSSNVGLLPAFLVGLNISKIRKGAQDIISKVVNKSFNDHIKGALMLTHLQSKQSINLNVLITYLDALYYFGKWYLQLWAESIGKKSKGITPIHSIGTTDQHSQMQLFLEGPKDKFFTFINKDHRGLGLKMNAEILKENNANYLAGKFMGDLMYAEQKSTLNVFITNKLPVREFFCKNIDEFTIGQLMAYFMMETILACHLTGVNPFNQPAVEQGKTLTKDYLSSKIN